MSSFKDSNAMVVLPQKHLLSIFSIPLLLYCNLIFNISTGLAKNIWNKVRSLDQLDIVLPGSDALGHEGDYLSHRPGEQAPDGPWLYYYHLASACLREKKKAWGFARTKLSPNVQSEITQIPRNSYKKYVSRSIWMKHFDKPPSNANSPRSVLESVHCCWVCGSEPKGTIWG